MTIAILISETLNPFSNLYLNTLKSKQDIKDFKTYFSIESYLIPK